MSSALRQRHTVGSVNSAASDAAHSSLDGRRPARSRQVAGLHLLPLLLLVFFAGSTVLTYYRHTLLPTPRDDATTPLSQFSEERARVHVKALCDMGVRVTGSVENEISAVRYLLQTLSDIRRAMPATGGAWDLEVSVQHPSGTFDLDFLGGFTSAYVNVTNIAARITPREARYASQAPNATALLVSAHFDSALGTQAATDDATNCGNMLEVLRAMTHRPSLPSAVIFLWNGAEETVLQASHGFITQHVWAPTISAFINLEGAGGSGRELVFQTGPKNEWIARAYSKAAPHPFFSIVGQDIFQSGAIPSDTDFRIYRDHGKIPGLDAAYISNGYVYHTALDRYDQVNQGAMQRCGENLLATVSELTNSPLLILTHAKYQQRCAQVPVKRGGNVDKLVRAHDAASTAGDASPLSPLEYDSILNAGACLNVERQQSESAVYFDVLGFIVLFYSSRTALYLNWIVAAVVAAYLAVQEYHRRKNTKAHGAQSSLLKHLGITLLSLLLSLLVPALIGLLLSLLAPMQWFSRPYLVIGLFSAPAVGVFAQVQRWARGGGGARRKEKDEEGKSAGGETDVFAEEELAYDASLLLWLILLVVLTILRVGSAFLALVFSALPLLGRTAGSVAEQILHADSTRRASSRPTKGWFFILGYLLGLILPVVLLTQANVVTVEFFLPLMGRSGTVAPSDAVQGVLCSVLLISTCFLALSLVHLVSSSCWRKTRLVLLAVFLLAFSFCLVNHTLHGASSAYSPTTPKRIILLHIEREVRPRGSDSFRSHEEFTPSPSSTAVLLPRSSHRLTVPPTSHGVWLIPMDFLVLQPLEGVKVQAKLLGRENEREKVDGQGRIELMSITSTLSCPSNRTLDSSTLFCDLPFFLPLKNLLPGTGWIDLDGKVERPKVKMHTVELIKVESLPSFDGYVRHRRLHFVVRNVATHMTLYVNNRPEFSKVLAWSFGESVPSSSSSPLSRPSLGSQYDSLPSPPEELFVFYAGGSPGMRDAVVSTQREIEEMLRNDEYVPREAEFLAQERTWEFWLETADAEERVTANKAAGREEMYLDFAVAAHHLSPRVNGFMEKLQAEMPDWSAPVVFTATLAQFQF